MEIKIWTQYTESPDSFDFKDLAETLKASGDNDVILSNENGDQYFDREELIAALVALRPTKPTPVPTFIPFNYPTEQWINEYPCSGWTATWTYAPTKAPRY